MSGKPKNAMMTPTEMIEMGKQNRKTSTIYKAESAQINDEAIAKTVMKGFAELANAERTQKIDLSDINLVKDISLEYIKACADSSSFPTLSGLARAMGVNRSTLYHWMRKKDTETGQWLMLCHDLYSDVLAELTLRNNCNPVVGIFLQKAMYGLSETDNVVLISQIQSDESAEDYTPQNYKDKYIDLIGE